MLPASRCVVLVPIAGAIDPGCEDGLRELERRGYVVRRVRGYSAIDAARSQMASDALADGFDELMWIDADIVFDPDLASFFSGDICRARKGPLCRKFALAPLQLGAAIEIITPSLRK